MSTNQPTTVSTRTDLQPLSPEEAARFWRESKMDELADATLELQGRHIDQFTDWLIDEDITDLREVSARTVHRFRLAIKSDLSQSTLSQRIGTVRRFLRFCTSLDAVHPETVERIDVPDREGAIRTETLEAEDADAALSYLRRFAYASREHAILALCWQRRCGQERFERWT
jgi:site-specific recombinase XerD